MFIKHYCAVGSACEVLKVFCCPNQHSKPFCEPSQVTCADVVDFATVSFEEPVHFKMVPVEF